MGGIGEPVEKQVVKILMKHYSIHKCFSSQCLFRLYLKVNYNGEITCANMEAYWS